MHFLLGLFWLAIVIAMISSYVLLPYTLYMSVRWRKATRLARLNQHDTEEPVTFWQPIDRKRLRIALIFVVFASLSAYAKQRVKWIGEDNANLKAKEYWVSGQVLNGFRQALTTVIHPEVFIMFPANSLQWAIYQQGVKQFPEKDGEVGVWQNAWFHCHYYKKGRRQLGLNTGTSSDKMRLLLDQWWFCLETMATCPFADKQMEEEHYYRDYPALAFSYEQYKGFYSYKKVGSAQRLAMMPKHVNRSRLLSRWLWELPSKWQVSPKALAFNVAHPKIVALLQADLLLELQALIQGEVHERKFACDNESVKRYVTTRTEFVAPLDGLPAYKRMKENDQGNRLYEIVIDGPGPRSTKYILSHYCQIDVAGQEDNNKRRYIEIGKLLNRTADEQASHLSKLNYSEEVEILEEQFHGR
ncbi:hypothetical protein [Desulfobulbus propionicus]